MQKKKYSDGRSCHAHPTQTKIHYLLFMLCILQSYSTLYGYYDFCGTRTAKPYTQDRVGNFNLPNSQQVGPFYGFGQNIIDATDVQVWGQFNQSIGHHSSSSSSPSFVLWGITDSLSFLGDVPFTFKDKSGCDQSSGMNDIFGVLEYAFIDAETKTSETQATAVFEMTLPTGSAKKNPNTGLGYPSFLFGPTFSRMEQWWYACIEGYAHVTIPYHGTKFGNTFFYEFMLEWTFAAPPHWIFGWIVEFYGTYTQKDVINGVKNMNSGGHIFSIAPSLWISSDSIIIQVGPSFPVVQNLFGTQNKQYYKFEFVFAYKFAGTFFDWD